MSYFYRQLLLLSLAVALVMNGPGTTARFLSLIKPCTLDL